MNRWLRASNIAFLFGGFQHFGQTFVCAQKVVWTCPKLSARIVVAMTGSKLIILPTDLCVNFFWFSRKYYHKIKRQQNHCRSVFRKGSQLLPGVNTTVGVWSNLAYCTAITFLPRDSWDLTCLGKHYTSMDYLKTLCQWSLLGELSRITIRQLSVFTIHFMGQLGEHFATDHFDQLLGIVW